MDLISDIYVEMPHSKFNQQHIDALANFQEELVESKKESYKSLVDDKMYYLDTEFDFDNAHKKQFIKTSSPMVLDLENYHTKVRIKGIVFESLKDNPFDKDVQFLINDLREKALYPIEFENLDPKMVQLMNEIGDDEVYSFHKNQYMDFENFGIQLTKDDLLTNMQDFQEKLGLIYKGYSVF